MIRLILVIELLIIVNTSYSQTEQEIVNNAVQIYKKELPKLEKRAFKQMRKLDKSKEKPKNREFDDYHFIIMPMFKLKKEYIQYHNGDTFAKYIDFEKMYYDFNVFIFKDTTYRGLMMVSYYAPSAFYLVNDANRYNKSAYMHHLNFARQIMNFKPDIVFYPECPMFMCFLKGGKLYIGKKERYILEYILPADEFIKKNPLFIQELHDNKNPGLKHYKNLN